MELSRKDTQMNDIVSKQKNKITKYKKEIAELREIIQKLKLDNQEKIAQNRLSLNSLTEEI